MGWRGGGMIIKYMKMSFLCYFNVGHTRFRAISLFAEVFTLHQAKID